METWSLNHPDVGLIEVERGYDAEFKEIDPSWPQAVPTGDDGNPTPYTDPPLDAGLRERFKAWVSSPPVRLRVKVDGDVWGRFDSASNGRIPLRRHSGKKLSSMTTSGTARTKPHLRVQTNMFGELLDVDYRNGTEVVEFEPPAGSRGAKRRAAMESSTFKRVAFPIATGLGKGGWALAVLVLGPIVSRFIGWLLSFIPDVDFPDWQLPSPPYVTLPVPHFPHIDLPTIPVPDWEFPEFDIPAWLEFLLEYTKIWVPIVLGIIFAITAVRKHRKSEQKKAQWSELDADREDGAETLEAVRGEGPHGDSARRDADE